MRQKSGGTGENRVGEDDTADTVIIGLGKLHAELRLVYGSMHDSMDDARYDARRFWCQFAII